MPIDNNPGIPFEPNMPHTQQLPERSLKLPIDVEKRFNQLPVVAKLNISEGYQLEQFIAQELETAKQEEREKLMPETFSQNCINGHVHQIKISSMNCSNLSEYTKLYNEAMKRLNLSIKQCKRSFSLPTTETKGQE